MPLRAGKVARKGKITQLGRYGYKLVEQLTWERVQEYTGI